MIRKNGILVPIAVKPDYTIISGHRRVRAAKEIGLKKVPITFVEFDNELDEREAVIEFNRQREKTFSQKMREAEELWNIEKERARKRQLSQLKKGNIKPVRQTFAEREKGKTRDKVAEKMNLGSGEQYRKAKKVWDKAKEGDQDAKKEIRKIDEGKQSITGAYRKIRRKEKIEKQKEAIQNLDPPQGLYDIIVVDPPWPYGTQYDPQTRRIASPYPEMSIQEIKDIDLPASQNCILWLWTTHKFIWEAKEILNHWGFEYKAMLIWDKEKMGIGQWLRLQCEFCLLGIKGSPSWESNSIRDIIREPRTEHSTKPETFYKMIDKHFAGRKLDYFGRKNRNGWEVYGVKDS